jgi:hypothetical protein
VSRDMGGDAIICEEREAGGDIETLVSESGKRVGDIS